VIKPFIDDINIKRIEKVKVFINIKSQFYKNGLNVIKFIYNLKNKKPFINKVTKIIN